MATKYFRLLHVHNQFAFADRFTVNFGPTCLRRLYSCERPALSYSSKKCFGHKCRRHLYCRKQAVVYSYRPLDSLIYNFFRAKFFYFSMTNQNGLINFKLMNHRLKYITIEKEIAFSHCWIL